MKKNLIMPRMNREWAPFAKALQGTTLEAFAWIYDPDTRDICSAATASTKFSNVVERMAFLLAVAGENKQERETIRRSFLKQFDHFTKELNLKGNK